MAETIAIGARTGVTPLITHMKVQGHEQGRADVITGQMREATGRGVYTAADVYPYLAGQTGLVAFTIPGWAQDGGREAMLKRFADPALRARIVTEAEAAMDARFGGPASVYLPELKQELTAVMKEMQVPAGEAVVRLLERSSPGIIARFGIEADLVKILQHPTASVACDCGAVVARGRASALLRHVPARARPLRARAAGAHLGGRDPQDDRSAGGARSAWSIAAGSPSAWLPMSWCSIRPGSSTMPRSRRRWNRPRGSATCWSTARMALRDGVPTGERAGQPLRRTNHMPTRPMNGRESRSVVAGFSARGVAAIVEVRQPENARRAEGTFRLTRLSGNIDLQMTEFGQLQTAAGWTSFTGVARLRPSEPERAVVVIVDGDDVFVQAGDFSFSTEKQP